MQADPPAPVHALGRGIAGNLLIARRLAVLVPWLIGCLAAYAVMRPFTRHNPVPRRFLGGAAWLIGVRWHVEGSPLRRKVLFLSNHLSWLDILTLASASGTAFVAKSELKGAPLVGFLCDLNRTIYVERQSRLAVGGQVDAVREALASGHPVTLFPEGTTGDGHALLPFKTAMFDVLDPPPADVRVQPVLLDYVAATRDIVWVGDESGVTNALRILARPGHISLKIRFLDPFSPMDYAGRKAVASEARRRMEQPAI